MHYIINIAIMLSCFGLFMASTQVKEDTKLGKLISRAGFVALIIGIIMAFQLDISMFRYSN